MGWGPVPVERGPFILPFGGSIGTPADATDYFLPLGVWTGATLPPTTEAQTQLTLSGYGLRIREVHAIVAVSGSLDDVALRDDGADVTGTALGALATDTEVSATGLNVTIAAGSKVGIRVRGNGLAVTRLLGFIVAEIVI